MTDHSSADPLLQIRGLHKWYGALHVLCDIDLGVAAGEKVVVCGPSGSGKSTLAYCINGLEAYQEGSIHIEGVLLSEEEGTAHELRRNIGFVFQQFNLFPHMSVLQNCMIGPKKVNKVSHEEAEARARAYLERVHIADQAAKLPSQLSGGQQQRVAIARALCMEPKLMLFDEPTSALDPEMVKEVLDVMIELAEQGMTMVCVTHEMGFARQAADRIVMMEAGQIIENSSTDKFFDDPDSERVRVFLSQIAAY